MDSDLKEKNLVMTSTISIDPDSKEKKYTIELDKDSFKKEDGFSTLNTISGYLNNYFMDEEILKREEKHEEEILHQIIELEKEEDPDKILEKLWEE